VGLEWLYVWLALAPCLSCDISNHDCKVHRFSRTVRLTLQIDIAITNANYPWFIPRAGISFIGKLFENLILRGRSPRKIKFSNH
jgi:hypothetical protein